MAKVDDKFHDDALKLLEKNYGKGFNSRRILEDAYKAIPTGHDDLDDVITKGAKGIFLGGIVEIFGTPGSGKTSLAMRTIGNAQKLDPRMCGWVDAESGFSPDLAEVNGVDLDNLIMPDLTDLKTPGKMDFPTSGEVMDMVFDMIMTGAFSMVVVDSVAGMMPMRVLAEDYDPNKPGVAEVARVLSEHLPRLSKACMKHNSTVIFINQLRAKPGDMWNPETTPGGWALPFFSDQRIRVEKIMSLKGQVIVTQLNDLGEEEENVIGHYARTKVIKTKQNKPPQEVLEIPIYYEHYFPDEAKRCYDLARKLQVITRHKSTLTWKSDDEVVCKVDGESEMLAMIRDNKWEARLADDCMKAEISERNRKLKNPVKVPSSIKDLAARYKKDKDLVKEIKKEAKEIEETIEKKRGRPKKTPPSVDLSRTPPTRRGDCP